MGEGGALLFQEDKYQEKAEILREKGTDRSKFFRGQVDKYTWIDFGDSYLPSELNAAHLWAQLEMAEEIKEDRLKTWDSYYEALKPLERAGKLELPVVPSGCTHNAHMFYIKCKNMEERTALISYMKSKDIFCVFHYIPLHSAPAGKKYGRFNGTDEYTTKESERLLRLPMYYGMKAEDIICVSNKIKQFYFMER